MLRIDSYNGFLNAMRLGKVNNTLQKSQSVMSDKTSNLKENHQDYTNYDFKLIIKEMGGKFLLQDPKTGDVEFDFNNDRYLLGDNGGELYMYKLTSLSFNVPYNDSTMSTIGNKTLAYRIKQGITGKDTDYNLNLDK